MSRWFLPILFVLAASAGSLRAELTDEQKRQLFLKAREDIKPIPAATATPAATARPVPKPTARPTVTPEVRKAATPEVRRAEPEPTPEKRKAEPTETPKATPEETPEPPQATPEPTPKPVKATPTPKPKATPKPAATPKSKPPAEVTIEKSGGQKEEGLAPAPARSFFGSKYRYLTPTVRRAIDKAPVKKGRWKYIIVHNSGTNQGNAKAFDSYHRNVRKMSNGLAYHFVIGNGSSSGNGEIEIGNRWVRQINGGHVASDYLNNIAIGICLVGDFNRRPPNQIQMDALAELITYLRSRCGKSAGKVIIVKGHREINPKPTDCPGEKFDLKWLHRKFGK